MVKDGRFRLRSGSHAWSRLWFLIIWSRSRNRSQDFFYNWSRNRSRSQDFFLATGVGVIIFLATGVKVGVGIGVKMLVWSRSRAGTDRSRPSLVMVTVDKNTSSMRYMMQKKIRHHLSRPDPERSGRDTLEHPLVYFMWQCPYNPKSERTWTVIALQIPLRASPFHELSLTTSHRRKSYTM